MIGIHSDVGALGEGNEKVAALLLLASVTLYKADADDHSVSKEVRHFPTFFCLVLRLLDELGPHNLCTFDFFGMVEAFKVIVGLCTALTWCISLGVTFGELLPVGKAPRTASSIAKS